MPSPTMRVEPDVYQRLLKLKGAIEAHEGRVISFSDALKILLQDVPDPWEPPRP